MDLDKHHSSVEPEPALYRNHEKGEEDEEHAHISVYSLNRLDISLTIMLL